MNLLTKPFKYIFYFIKKHPIWTVVIICFVLCFIDGYKSKEWNFYGYTLLGLIIIAVISPYIRKQRKEKAEKRRIDYAAQKFAEEFQWTPISESQPYEKPEIYESGEPNINYSSKYQKKLLLTKNEWYEWKKLNQYAVAKGLVICPKVRLLDLLEPRRGEKDYMSCLGKIQSKHVDFVICDKNMYVKGIIELDDNSHNSEARKQRDAFIDQVLTSVGYKVIHVRAVTENTLDFINNKQSTPDGQNTP